MKSFSYNIPDKIMLPTQAEAVTNALKKYVHFVQDLYSVAVRIRRNKYIFV